MRGATLGLRVVAFDLGSCAWTSHTPGPSREGRFENCVLFGNEWVDGDVSPLERGLRGVLR